MYVAAFAIGFGPIPWVMNVELFPKEARVSTTPHPTKPKYIQTCFKSTDVIVFLCCSPSLLLYAPPLTGCAPTSWSALLPRSR